MQALRAEPDNVKALYRRAVVYLSGLLDSAGCTDFYPRRWDGVPLRRDQPSQGAGKGRLFARLCLSRVLGFRARRELYTLRVLKLIQVFGLPCLALPCLALPCLALYYFFVMHWCLFACLCCGARCHCFFFPPTTLRPRVLVTLRDQSKTQSLIPRTLPSCRACFRFFGSWVR